MNEMQWDLSQLVESTDPAYIVDRLEKMVADAGALNERYKGRIEGLDAAGLFKLLESRDEFSLKYEGAAMFCNLRYSANSTDPVAQQLNDAMRRAGVRAGQKLAFMDLELGKLLAARPELVQAPELEEFRHLLERIVRRVPHQLSEVGEQLVMTKDQNGIDAWSQLQGDWLSTRSFRITVDGEEKELPYGQVIGLYEDPRRDVRKEANRVVYDVLGKDDIVWSTALRSVCADHIQMCEWRKYPSVMTQSLMANDVEEGAVHALMRTMEKNVDVYRRYLAIKAKLMSLPKLGNWDIIAPLPNDPGKKYSWEDARKNVVDAYTAFDPEFGKYAKDMHETRHIDAEVRKGKVSGAFCATWFDGRSAYVLQSFNGLVGDVYTQAHELGHAIHAYLGSRAQRPSNYEIGSCIAECGSTFGELLLTEHLLSNTSAKEEKQAVLCKVLDEFGMAAFQVSARYFFEHSMYDAIKDGRFLDGETISSLWTAARDKIYGDAVEWLPEMKWEWTMKLHYYIPSYRFYNYPYVFAQLFVFAMYRLYLEQGEAFVPKVKALLSAGSSRSPGDLARELGFDISSEGFWQKGIQQAETFISQLEDSM
jgi:oligoendopeptidase F